MLQASREDKMLIADTVARAAFKYGDFCLGAKCGCVHSAHNLLTCCTFLCMCLFMHFSESFLYPKFPLWEDVSLTFSVMECHEYI